jgi:apolipoprotein N-acyltransferase
VRKTYSEKIKEYLPAAISGALLVPAFPVFDLYFLAWVAFVPLLLSSWGKSPRAAFASGYVFGIIYFFGTLYWIYHSINYYGGVSFFSSLLVVFLLCAYLSLYPAFFSALFATLLRKTKLPALLIAPVMWVVLEFIRSYALTGFPWSSIGYSQYKFLPLIQIADITGVYGISFIILAVNGAFADVLLLKKRVRQMPLFPVSYTVLGLVFLVIAVAASFLYGMLRMDEQRKGQKVTASIVQANIEQDKKWEPSYQSDVIDTYFTLSRKASLNVPHLIVWPETAAPFFFGSDIDNTEKLLDFHQGLASWLLFGSVMVEERTEEKTLLTNSAVLLNPAGKTMYRYDKIHLVPFGEYVPLRNMLFFIDKIVAGIGDYVPGDEYVKAETDFGRFATLICYEIIFPGLVRKFYTDGGDFIVTITNDAWFGRTSGPYQHFSMAVFRAVENRKPVIRAANTGISGFIDSNGAVESMTPLFERQVVTHSIKTDSTLTFYTKYGDLFAYLCIVLSVCLFINVKFWR